ncbi:MAG: hypothetical protein ACP5UN_02990, partial [Candidatus Micrarchaeia archaeon]
YDSTDIYQELHYNNIKLLIPTNGRGFYKSKKSKDPEYGKRWSIERFFQDLKKCLDLQETDL